MKRFARLFTQLDASNRTGEKLAALKRYFAEVPAADAAWAVFLLTGNRIKRPVRLKDFREWAGAACGYPEWMVAVCYDHVGDLAETLALLLASRKQGHAQGHRERPLHEVIEDRILPLRAMDAEAQRRSVETLWAELDETGCLAFNKLITGGFRVGVSKGLVTRALAELAEVDPAVMAHRLMGQWQPAAGAYKDLFEPEASRDEVARPYPFCLASPLDRGIGDDPGQSLGEAGNWLAEWKWDGIRAQLIKRGSTVLLWSRGEELVGPAFPEIIEAAARWSGDAVLDGEILAWGGSAPASFGALQKRLGKKGVGPKLLRDIPVVFMVYDLLETDGIDQRDASLAERRQRLEAILVPDPVFRISEVVEGRTWADLAAARERSRELGVEGLMLKHLRSPYGSGRKRGDWWKWKVDPYTVDAVLVYAQQGHGRRAGLYTDYTFSVRDGEQLVPFAKAYSGLSDAEIRRVDRWIRDHTRERHGPVRVVDPELIFEIAFEGIAESRRHRSGVAVRFPRIHRWREDKTAAEADTLDTVRALLPSA